MNLLLEKSINVFSIVEDLPDFKGKFPGRSNLRDLGDVTKYGNRFVKHSSPLNLAMYSLLDKDSINICIKICKKRIWKI